MTQGTRFRDPPGRARTLTFLLTRIEASALDAKPAVAVAAEHVQLIASPVEANHGAWLEGGSGTDTMMAVFRSDSDAVAAALDIQRAFSRHPEGGASEVKVRIGLHTGEARTQDRGTLTELARRAGSRLRDVAYPGQTLLSSVTGTIVADALPAGSWLRELGAHRLRDSSVAERVFELCHPELVDDFPPLPDLDMPANKLPLQPTRFIGRAKELTEVAQLLGQDQLLTLIGTGGCGKTRLAVQAAATLADLWPDGVWWVDLGPVTDPSRVAELVASSTGVIVEPVGGALRSLTLQLRDRNMLVCLDNCEHLLGASAELVDALSRACQDVSVLATSREPLGVAGETVWRVPSMVLDDAVALFAQRASQAQPGFVINDSNEDAVHAVCRRLDGIPLAIELTAAWLRVLTPAQIAAGLNDRFHLPAGSRWGVPPRQQTLAASVEWSYELLDEPDRELLRRLAVFAGGFNVDAVRAVCLRSDREDDALVGIGRLADKSLVVVDQGDSEARFRLLETIRQYAHERLQDAGEVAATRDRHLDYFLALAETAEPELERADQDAWLATLETEHDNLRSALDWGLSTPRTESGRRLAAVLPRLWLLHGHSHEGIGYLTRAIGLAPDDRSALQTKLLIGSALLGAAGGQFGLTAEAAQRGLDLATANGDDRSRGRCLNLQAYIHVYFDFATARELSVQARACAEAAGDVWATDLSLLLEGLALTNCDRHEDARPILDAAVERSRRHGDRILAVFALIGRMEAALRTGDVRAADQLGTEALRLAEPLGDYFTVGFTTCNLAWVKGVAGDIDAGLRLMDTVVRSLERSGHAVDVPAMAVSLGQLQLWGGDLEGAEARFTQAVRFGEAFGDNLIVARALPGLATVHRRRGVTDTAREYVERAIAIAGKLDLPRMLAEALDESAVLVAADDLDRAEALHHQALSARVEHGLRTHYVDSLDALARIAFAVGGLADAARLYAASDTARQLMGYPRPPVDQADHRDVIAALATALSNDELHGAWSEGATLSLDDAVAYISRARGARGRPPTGWASLTPTELKVVGLATEGLTNAEIATRLFMGRETVKTHLAHVYAKLNVANRTELATLATSRAISPP